MNLDMLIGSIGKLALATALSLAPIVARAQAEGQTSVDKLKPPQPDWFYVRAASGGTVIVDSHSGKMLGMVNTSRSSDMAIDPAGKKYYVSESIWTLGNRGVRQDMITVFDSENLKIQAEIKMPGRMQMSGRVHNFILSEDGATAFVYDLDPASTVKVVDLAKQKFVRTIDLVGCATLIPNAGGFAALCSDGSMATVDTRALKIAHSAPFFDAGEDPIFDNYNYDPVKKAAVFVSYTGLIYTAKMGTTPVVSEPFSLQVAAGFRQAQPKPLDLAYYPGGDQPSAWHVASNRLFVLVHPGEYWSHIAPGTQLWVVDLATKKVTKRIQLKDPVSRIEVTQGPKPMLYLTKGTNGLIMDPDTGKVMSETTQFGGGAIQTTANSF